MHENNHKCYPLSSKPKLNLTVITGYLSSPLKFYLCVYCSLGAEKKGDQTCTLENQNKP